MTKAQVLMGWRKRWNRNLLRFLGSRARAPDVEDLAQETYLRLLRAPDLETVRNPEAYLITVANNVLGEWHRQRHIDTLLLNSNPPADHFSLEVEADACISQSRIDELLASLSPMMWAVLLLRLRDDCSCKAIARDLGLSERQVKRQLARGYDLLRRALEAGSSR